MIYNRVRHLELAKRYQEFGNLGKSFFLEDRENAREFSNYRFDILDHLLWENRDRFVSILEDFIKKRIDGKFFFTNFSLLSQKIDKEYHEFLSEIESGSEKFQDFHPDLRSRGFSSLITSLSVKVDFFFEDYENPDFSEFLKEDFLKLQHILEESEA
jgi:hypothetical protein